MNDDKPVESGAPTDVADTTSQQTQEKTAAPSVEVPENVSAYLKGLGLDSVQATPELIKVAEAGMKQKESVSKMSLEKEQLLARLASQGKDTSEPEPQVQEEVKETPTASAPASQEDTNIIGVTDNDLFDLSRMITTEFKEIAPQAEDGSLFRELRQLGYFTSKGIDKKAVYDYLAAKNAQAAELRELREFKQKYGQPDPSAAPQYNTTPGVKLKDGELTKEMAHQIVLTGQVQNPNYQDAIALLKKEALK